jgi:L-histidine N-alpha-methyltransferase
MNDSIGSDFDPDHFEHRAVYNIEDSRIEMWLISNRDQEIYVGNSGYEGGEETRELSIHFAAGEGIRTEISTKFTRESAKRMFEESGMTLEHLYTDKDDLFGVSLARPK